MASPEPSLERKPVGILYEHPEWFLPLFEELHRRGIPYTAIDATTLRWDPAVTELPFSVVFNRMSPSAWLRGHTATIQSTANYLAYLEDVGVPVINGSKAYGFEISKARQLRLLNELGIAHPRALVVNSPSQVVGAAQELTYPILVKPNVGGSGAGIVSFDTPEALSEAASDGDLEFGPDGTALVQEHIKPLGDSIVRIEFLAGRYLYGIRLRLTPGTFNLCPADYCDIPGVSDATEGAPPIEAYKPPQDIIADAQRLLDATGADLGGVEYLINAETGEPTFYDINTLSNFVSDAQTVIGFDPFVDLVDFIDDTMADR